MENKKLTGIVIRHLLDRYMVAINLDVKQEIEAKARGNIKRNNAILVGDQVEVEKNYDIYTIEKVLPRHNSLIRPPVANIDTLIIVLSLASPSPDYMLLDKELVLCKAKQITPIICVNKWDLLKENASLQQEIEYLTNVYTPLCDTLIYTSTIEKEGMEQLQHHLQNRVSAFSGNSGVGKSSMITQLLGDGLKHEIEVGNVSSKTKKGKHTTKYVQLYELAPNSYILDTPGFSSYELYDISYKELKQYYEEFHSCHCDYEDCSHVLEDVSICDVKRQVAENKIDKGRYERYVYLYTKLKEIEDRKYK